VQAPRSGRSRESRHTSESVWGGSGIAAIFLQLLPNRIQKGWILQQQKSYGCCCRRWFSFSSLLGSTTAPDEEEAQTGEHSKDFQQLRVQPRLRSFPAALIYTRHLQEEEEEEEDEEEDEDPST